MRRKALFYVLLGLATVGLGRFLQAWREWRRVPAFAGGVEVALVGLGVLATMLWLGFLLYEVDRAAGRVRHRVGVYEWVLARRAEARRPDLLEAEGPGQAPRGSGRAGEK